MEQKELETMVGKAALNGPKQLDNFPTPEQCLEEYKTGLYKNVAHFTGDFMRYLRMCGPVIGDYFLTESRNLTRYIWPNGKMVVCLIEANKVVIADLPDYERDYWLSDDN